MINLSVGPSRLVVLVSVVAAALLLLPSEQPRAPPLLALRRSIDGSVHGGSGTDEVVLAIAVLSRGGADGVARRATYRRTTLALLRAAGRALNMSVAARFFLGAAPAPPPPSRVGEMSAAEQADADANAAPLLPDVERVPGRGEHDLWVRTHRASRWGADLNARFWVKTDDDAFVRADTLLAELAGPGADKPSSRLYWGREVGPGKALKWIGGCQYETIFVHAECPRYMTGLGYVLSGDLVRFVASLDLDHYYKINDGWQEDANMGLILSGLDLVRIDDERFHDVHGSHPQIQRPLSAASVVAHKLSEPELLAAYEAFGPGLGAG